MSDLSVNTKSIVEKLDINEMIYFDEELEFKENKRVYEVEDC